VQLARIASSFSHTESAVHDPGLTPRRPNG
jgi:hypothetical protein